MSIASDFEQFHIEPSDWEMSCGHDESEHVALDPRIEFEGGVYKLADDLRIHYCEECEFNALVNHKIEIARDIFMTAFFDWDDGEQHDVEFEYMGEKGDVDLKGKGQI